MQQIKSRLALLSLIIMALAVSFTGRWTSVSHIWAQDSAADSALRRASGKITMPPKHEDIQRVLAAPYYKLDEKLSATLILSNQGPHLMEVTVSLFNLAGVRLDVPPLILDGRTVHGFDLRELAEAGGTSFQEGSVQVSYLGMLAELAGVVKLLDAKQSLIFDEELTEPARMFGSSHLEGVWWLPSRESELRVAVSNTTDKVVTATAAISGEQGQSERRDRGDRGGEEDQDAGPQQSLMRLELAPHETHVLDVRKILRKGEEDESITKIGGISITHDGPKGGVLARGFIEEPRTGFSNVVEFYDPHTVKSSKLDGAGLRIGQVAGQTLRQIAVARNIGEEPVIIKGRLPYTRGDGTQGVIDLPEIRLAAGRTRALDLAKAIRASGIGDLAAVGLEFEHSGIPGNVALSALSMSPDGNQVFRVPIINAGSVISNAGTYPWSIDDSSSTFVYIKNVTELPQRYTMSIWFEDGSYSLGLKTLDAHQTVAFDLRELRDDRVLDVNGKTLPPEATHGQVHWSIQEPRIWQLIGRVEQVDLDNGISMTAACACCPNQYFSSWIDPFGVRGFVGDRSLFVAKERQLMCFGQPDEILSFNPFTWVSSIRSVADTEVDANGRTTGWVAALGPGSARISATWQSTNWFADESAQPPQCIPQPVPINEGGTCDVIPIVTVTCTAQHLAFGPTAPASTTNGSCSTTTSPAGGTFVWSVNTNTVTLTASGGGANYSTINPSVSQGDTTISVTYTVNQQSNTALSLPITVHKPTSLMVLSDTTNPTGQSCTVKCLATPGSGNCNATAQDCVYSSPLRTRNYSTLDQFGSRFVSVGISAADVRESWVTISSTCPNTNFVTNNSPVPDFLDDFWLCHTCCLSGGPGCSVSRNQTITVNGLTVRQVGANYACSAVTLNP